MPYLVYAVNHRRRRLKTRSAVHLKQTKVLKNLAFEKLVKQVAVEVSVPQLDTTIINLTTQQAALLIGVKPNTLAKLRASGFLADAEVRNGRRVFYRTSRVVSFIYKQVSSKSRAPISAGTTASHQSNPEA